ncbi:MAG: hypothetical protein CMC70_06095 [Flavobacteriaceae bacterium]|nr:hypothetical protein [Flavobacteriaceae bacterium]
MIKYFSVLIAVVIVVSCSKDDAENQELIAISDITNITDLTATISGTVQEVSGTTISAKGFVWEIAPNPVIEYSDSTNEGNSSGSFTSNISNLSRDTEYFVRAYVTTNEGTMYSEQRSFTTTNICPGGTYQGDITLHNQDMVNKFGSNQYCNVNGLLRIHSFGNTPPITDLSPLSSLSKVSSLVIDYNYVLPSLNGLNIKETEGLVLIGNDALTHIDALSSITSTMTRMIIEKNEKLENLDGLSGLTQIDAEIIGLYLIDNPALTNINGIANVTSFNGNLIIENNPSLVHLDGLINIETIDGYLEIDFNENLQNLNGLSNLKHVNGWFTMYHNTGLTNLDGLQSLESVNEHFSINSNKALTNISGLANLKTTNGRFSIVFSDHLTSLDGLSSLQTTGGFRIGANKILSDFCDVTSLIQNGGVLGEYEVMKNAYNPTQQDIIDGNCSL